VTAQASAAPTRRTPRAGRAGLTIQSKLLIMLLAVSVGSTLAVGAVGYVSGTDSLRDAAYDKLASLREARTLEVQNLLGEITDNIVLTSKGATAVQATREFTAGLQQLDAQGSTAAQQQAVAAYYDTVFVPRLEESTGGETDPSLFLPTSPGQTYLQSLYTAPFDDFDAAALQQDAGDGSAWSAANAAYNPYFLDMAERYGYEDVMLLDTEGNVVYSVYKGVDLGTNLRTGPYAGTALASAYETAINSNTLDAVTFEDYERYQPSYDVPTGWAATTVGDGTGITGALAVQFPLSAANDVMTVGGEWEQQGMGETGEAYLVGSDHLMRSTSRTVVEDPEAYLAEAVKAGTDPGTAERIAEVGGTVLLQEVDTPSVAAALMGETGVGVETNYLGRETLTSYAPLELDGVEWVVVSSIDTSEAFAPVADFARNLALTIAGIIALVALLSLVLAQVFARPVRSLVTAVRRVAAGELGAEVPIRTRDEFGDLAATFNDMSRTLQIKQDLIEQQRTENDDLLRTLMPDAVAQRFREGEETIAQTHEEVAVVFADLVGFDAFTAGLSPDEELRHLNGLLRGFDEAAERTGIERVRTLREGYLASCGLIVPRVDNVRRIVEFTLEMRKVIARFNATNGTQLQLRAGIDSGPVTSGLVGRSSLAYDMWGEAVSLANSVQRTGGQAGIFVTDRVRTAMADSIGVAEAGSIQTATGSQPVWEVVDGEARA
jgi:class 3 adenylate cyclase